MTSFSLLVLSTLLAAAGPQAQPGAPGTVVVPRCVISLMDEAQVPAQEPGMLVDVGVKEGREVKKGELLAQIDDAKPQMEKRVAEAKLLVAKEEASNDVPVKYATASARTARADYDVFKHADNVYRGAVTAVQLRQLEMKMTEAELSIDKAKMEKRIAGHQTNVAQAEVDAAEENVNRRKIRAPLDGVVVRVHRRTGEWVQPGDPVAHVVRIDRLRIEGFLPREYAPSDILGRPVDISVELPHNQRRTVRGEVTFVKPMIEAGGYPFRVEVKNSSENGAWVLAPNMPATMTIYLKGTRSRGAKEGLGIGNYRR